MKKKLPAVALADYRSEVDTVRTFLTETASGGHSTATMTRCYDHAALSVYRAFEQFVLEVCIARINRDPTTFYAAVGVEFGRHLTAAQCEFLLVGDRYFDFRGHSGLVEVLKTASGSGSPTNAPGTGSAMVDAVKDANNRKAFEILAALRNYVAHESSQSRKAALKAMQEWEPNRKNLGKAGSWLKATVIGQTRLERLLAQIDALCQSLANAI